MKSRFLILISVAALILSACDRQERASISRNAPERVIWIAIDSLRADHLSSMGYERETTPWLDDLAKDSAVFTAAYAPAGSTGFSVGATFSGVYYSLMDYASHPTHIPDSFETLAQALQRTGFDTYAWITNLVLIGSHDLGYSRGFDQWHALIPRRSPSASIDELIEYVRAEYQRGDGPEFHYLHTMDVHLPYRPPMPFDRSFPDVPVAPGVQEGSLVNVEGDLVLSRHPYHSELHDITDADVDYLLSQYDGAIKYTDSKMPELLDALDYDPARDLLIVSADHGEQFFDHGFWGHGKSLFPEEIHVPLLIHYQGIQPRIHETPVSLVDLYPTLCELFNVAPNHKLSGVSLLPALRGGEVSRDEPILAEAPYWTGGVLAPEAALIDGDDYYLVQGNANFMKPWKLWPVYEGLYSLNHDPHAQQNQIDERLARADELNATLRAINPRWAPYTPELIRPNPGMPEIGENVLTALMPVEPEIAQSPDGVGLVEPAFDLQATAAVEPETAYVLTVRYRLESGRAKFALIDGESGDVIWEYPLRKATEEPVERQAVIEPQSSTCRLGVVAEPGANIQIESATLRPVARPKFDLVPWRQHGEGPAELELDEQTRKQLEALGYVN